MILSEEIVYRCQLCSRGILPTDHVGDITREHDFHLQCLATASSLMVLIALGYDGLMWNQLPLRPNVDQAAEYVTDHPIPDYPRPIDPSLPPLPPADSSATMSQQPTLISGDDEQ